MATIEVANAVDEIRNKTTQILIELRTRFTITIIKNLIKTCHLVADGIWL
jgi:hypothetical protein